VDNRTLGWVIRTPESRMTFKESLPLVIGEILALVSDCNKVD
jgi:hypothetical protein